MPPAPPAHPVPRLLEPLLLRRLAAYPVVVITGPRQSGKTTLARSAAPDAAYLSLEEPDTRSFAGTMGSDVIVGRATTDRPCDDHHRRFNLDGGPRKSFADRSVGRYDPGTLKVDLPDRDRRQVGAAAAFLDARLALGRCAFSMTDIVAGTGLSSIAARFQLLRLGPKVVRVSPRQPFFLIVAPEHRSLGAPPVGGWLHDYFHWLGRPYYLALQSAASLYGSNPQAVQVTQIMTDRPMRPIRVGRTQLRFFVKRHIDCTPTLQPEGAVAPIRVSTPEATAYDLVRHADVIGGMERAAETLGPFASRLRRRELRRVLAGEGKVSVAQRLGFVLEAMGESALAKVVQEWLSDQLVAARSIPSGGAATNGILEARRHHVPNNSSELKP